MFSNGATGLTQTDKEHTKSLISADLQVYNPITGELLLNANTIHTRLGDGGLTADH